MYWRNPILPNEQCTGEFLQYIVSWVEWDFSSILCVGYNGNSPVHCFLGKMKFFQYIVRWVE
jgi:hypothetical protein